MTLHFFQVNCYTAVALTKLDILDDFDEIKIGVEYLKNGKKLDHYPSSEQVYCAGYFGAFLSITRKVKAKGIIKQTSHQK